MIAKCPNCKTESTASSWSSFLGYFRKRNNCGTNYLESGEKMPTYSELYKEFIDLKKKLARLETRVANSAIVGISLP